MFSLKLLGGASIEGPDGPVTGSAVQRRRLGLLALLATAPERGISRDKLVGYLWPERDEERARHALSDSVYRLNKELGGEGILAVGAELRLNPAVVASDVRQFREAVESEAWQEAVRVYAGPFLDGFFLSDAPEFERWVETERGLLARQYADALEALARQRAEAGDLAGAATVWSRLAAHDPYSARYAIGLMEALAAAGDRAGALRHARIHAQLVEQEFGAPPDPDVVALAERLRGEPAAAGTTAAPARETPPGAEPPAARAADDVVASVPGAASTPAASAAPIESGADDVAPGAPGESAPAPVSPPPPGRWPVRALAGALALAVLLAAAWLAWPGKEAATPSSSSRVRLAVLPLDNLSPNEENRYFADGVTEDILTHLARVPDLFVVSSASVLPETGRQRPVAEIAAMLGVDYILRGSVRRDGERVRITAQLVDADQNAHVWAETYDERLEDIFAVQSEIATRVAAALNAEIVSGVRERIARAPTADLIAYNLYLRGRYFWHRRTQAALLESARFFEEAVARDSRFARAWAGIADAYAVLAFYDYLPPATAYPKAEAAARRALQLDPSLAEAHASLGYIALYYDWDWDAAEAAFQRSIELNPSYTVAHQWYANHLVARGRFDEAAREMTHARELNPLSLIANGALGWVYFFAHRYEDAIAQCDLALEMAPDWDLCHIWSGQAFEQLGRRDDAIASLQRAVELSGGSGISVAALARAYATFGEPERARELLAEMLAAGEYRPSYEIAKVYVALGEHDRAIDWLERAYEEHAHSMAFLKVDPQLEPLHGNARFERLAERVGV